MIGKINTLGGITKPKSHAGDQSKYISTPKTMAKCLTKSHKPNISKMCVSNIIIIHINNKLSLYRINNNTIFLR